TLVDGVMGIRLGVDRDEYHVREIAIAQCIDQLDESALLHGEIDGNAKAQIIDEPAIDKIFFFQAEDGIRDYKVTGVQTCALPILTSRAYRIKNKERVKLMVKDWVQRNRNKVNESGRRNARKRYYRNKSFVKNYLSTHQIGRASCRERV